MLPMLEQTSSAIPESAKYILYRFPKTEGTVQKTLVDIEEVLNPHKVERTRTAIQNAELSGYAYGVLFKDKDHNLLGPTYIMNVQWWIKDTFEISNGDQEYDMDADREQAEASKALEWTGLHHYVVVKTQDQLIYIAFDPNSMIVVDELRTP